MCLAHITVAQKTLRVEAEPGYNTHIRHIAMLHLLNHPQTTCQTTGDQVFNIQARGKFYIRILTEENVVRHSPPSCWQVTWAEVVCPCPNKGRVLSHSGMYSAELLTPVSLTQVLHSEELSWTISADLLPLL